ncbi:MAG: hypothetical protein WBD07_18300 [Vicinamibacterales bacterium]
MSKAKPKTPVEPTWATTNTAWVPTSARFFIARAANELIEERLYAGSLERVNLHSEALAKEIYPDYGTVYHAYGEICEKLHRALGQAAFDSLERATWALDARHAEAAYRLGLEVGRRMAGGAR